MAGMVYAIIWAMIFGGLRILTTEKSNKDPREITGTLLIAIVMGVVGYTIFGFKLEPYTLLTIGALAYFGQDIIMRWLQKFKEMRISV